MSTNKSKKKLTPVIIMMLAALFVFAGASYAKYVKTATAQSGTATVSGFYNVTNGSISTGTIAPTGSGTYTAATISKPGGKNVPVPVEVTHSATLTFDENWKNGESDYMPIVFTVNGTPISWDEKESLTAFAGRVTSAIAATEVKKYDANCDAVPQDILTLSWSWPDDADNNAADTALAEKQPTFSLTVNTIVSQDTSKSLG